MDPKELRSLMEAYSEVYAPQEVNELYKGKHGQTEKEYQDSRSHGGKMISGDSKSSGAAWSHRSYKGVGKPAKPGERQANQGKMDRGTRADIEYRKANLKKEELDIFDVVLEFLYVEGFAETLEDAEWMMANVIDEEAIEIILGEEELDEASRRDEFTRAAIARNSGKKGGITFEPGPNWDASANRGKGAHISPKQKEKQRRKALRQEDFELWVNSLVEEGYDLSDYTWDDMYKFYLDEAITSEKGKAKAAEMIAKRSTPSGRAKPGQGASVSQIKHISRSNREGLGLTPATRSTSGSNRPKSYSGMGGTGNKAARRAGLTPTREKPNAWKEEYIDEAQAARENPEKYEREQAKKSAPVRGERTPMPPRGDKRREDFEKWYAKQMGR